MQRKSMGTCVNKRLATCHGFALPVRPRLIPSDAGEPPKTLWISQEDVRNTEPKVLMDLLFAEKASMAHWIELAHAFKYAGRIEHFESILMELESKLNAKHSDADENYRGSIYAALALHNLTQSEQTKQRNEERSKRTLLADTYMKLGQGSRHFSWHIAMGQYHLNRFMRSRETEERVKAAGYFKGAMNLRPKSIAATVYYANTLVMENLHHAAAVFYMRALLLCNHVKIVVTLGKQKNRYRGVTSDCELDQMDVQTKHLEALLLFALASCKFGDNELEAAKVLVERSLQVQKTPIAMRLKAAIAAGYLMERRMEMDFDSAGSSNPSTPRESNGSLIAQWNDAACEAYALDTSNPLGQLHLCELLFRNGRVDECEAKLEKIATRELSVDLQVHFSYQLARCAHAKSNWEKALTWYQNALVMRADFLPARVQMIKAAVGSNNLASAREHCDYLSQYNNKTPNTMRLTALVYMASAVESLDTSRARLLQADGNLADIDVTCSANSMLQEIGRLLDERLFRALGILEEAMAVEPNNALTMEYLIYCLELLVTRGRENLMTKLREAYKKYFATHRGPMSIELRNNDAILALRFREFREALQKLNALWQEVQTRAELSSPVKLTIQFNLALALEEAGQVLAAQSIYSTITREFPRYTAAWLRKSALAFRRGDVEKARRYLEQLKMHHKRSVEPWLYKAHQLFTLGQFDECLDELRKLFRTLSAANFDAYANTLFACALIRRGCRGGFGPLPKDVVHYARAGLRRPGLCNFYAANCIAIYLAHEGNLKAAYESFGILLESLATDSTMRFVAHRNMGLFCAATAIGNERRIERGNLDKVRGAKAQQHLQAALAHNRMDVGTHLVYARFLYDCQRLDECVQFLEMCRQVFPNDVKFLYNTVIAIDAVLCKHIRNSDKLASSTDVARMLTQAYFAKSTAAYLLTVHSDYPKMSSSHLQQISARAKDKLIPHMEGALPQLEATAAAKQRSKGKNLELQMTIQQAHEAKRLQEEKERQRNEEALSALSEELLKEASEIASELMYYKTPDASQPGNVR
ncbi:tetratricopeptide repeat-containing protein [Babesia caballi]|uniref:Tetratricopeptide repeat-containing protein n=1 Tax=Babesia caballi TaxID=5871 RepID=A0AAV4M0L4_BABCB|nr:tetratricopeptide repeat-containing protein [Babesia caballi]